MVISEQELSFSKYREFRDTLGFQKSLEMPPVAAISKQSAAIPGRSEKKKVFELQCNRVKNKKNNSFSKLLCKNILDQVHLEKKHIFKLEK